MPSLKHRSLHYDGPSGISDQFSYTVIMNGTGFFYLKPPGTGKHAAFLRLVPLAGLNDVAATELLSMPEWGMLSNHRRILRWCGGALTLSGGPGADAGWSPVPSGMPYPALRRRKPLLGLLGWGGTLRSVSVCVPFTASGTRKRCLQHKPAGGPPPQALLGISGPTVFKIRAGV